MTDTSISLSSAALIDIGRTLSANTAAASERLVLAEAALAESIRSEVLTGNGALRISAQAEVTAARDAHVAAQASEREASKLLAEAQASERAQAEEIARAEVRDLLTQLEAAADASDTAYATFLGKHDAAKRIEAHAMRICRDRLGNEVFGASIPQALGEAAIQLNSLRGGAPQGIEPWHKKWAGKALAELRRAARI